MFWTPAWVTVACLYLWHALLRYIRRRHAHPLSHWTNSSFVECAGLVPFFRSSTSVRKLLLALLALKEAHSQAIQVAFESANLAWLGVRCVHSLVSTVRKIDRFLCCLVEHPHAHHTIFSHPQKNTHSISCPSRTSRNNPHRESLPLTIKHMSS